MTTLTEALAAVNALREEAANARHNGCYDYADEHEGYADAIEPVLRALAPVAEVAPGSLDALLIERRGESAAKMDSFDRTRFEAAPCYICGYNGQGYFQPDLHKCSTQYHSSAANPVEPKLPGQENGANPEAAFTAAFAANPSRGEGDRRDAERWRWLAAEHERIDPLAAVVWKASGRGDSNWVNTANLAREVDAAMGAGK